MRLEKKGRLIFLRVNEFLSCHFSIRSLESAINRLVMLVSVGLLMEMVPGGRLSRFQWEPC